jgi:hypothetical protein
MVAFQYQYSHFEIDDQKSYKLPCDAASQEFLETSRHHRAELRAVWFNVFYLSVTHFMLLVLYW